MGAAEYKPLPSHRSSSPADANPASPTAQFLHAAAWVAFWIVCSVSIIIVNKHVITYSGFNFPISLAFWHMFLGTLTSRAAVQALGMTDTIREQGSPALYFQVGMIGVLFAATLVTGNAALHMLTVPTVQMLKASGPATIYFMGVIMGNEKLGLLQTLKVGVVCTGVGIASYGDISLTVLGFVLQVASIMADATRCCALQKVMQANHLEVGPLVTLSHVAPFAMAALSLPAVLFEGPRLLDDYEKWRGAVPMVLLSGLLASILNLVVFKIIRLTSALTTSLSGVLKEWACILVAMWVYGTQVTKLQWVGYSIAICGLLWYQSGRLRAAQARVAAGGPGLAGSKDHGSKHSSSGEDSGVVVTLLASGRSSSADSRGSSGSGWDDAGAGNVVTTGSRVTSQAGSQPLLRVKV